MSKGKKGNSKSNKIKNVKGKNGNETKRTKKTIDDLRFEDFSPNEQFNNNNIKTSISSLPFTTIYGEEVSPSRIYYSKDYKKFKYLDGGRKVKPLRFDLVYNSMKEKNLGSVILINQNYEIIDGQCRYLCYRKLGYEIPYRLEKMTAKESLMAAVLLNNESRNNVTDSLDMGVAANLKNSNDYILFNKYKSKGLPYSVLYALSSGYSYTAPTQIQRDFKNLTFTIKDKEHFIKYCEYLISFSQYNPVTGKKILNYPFNARDFYEALLEIILSEYSVDKDTPLNLEDFRQWLLSNIEEFADCRDWKQKIEDLNRKIEKSKRRILY